MKKVILFLWFGDEKPQYISWTLENFRQMNPGWEIKYIEYSNEQLKNYKEQGDPVLAATTPNKCFNFWVDRYKGMYLNEHKDELVIYCDLDCFPIAPFDNFLMTPDKKFAQWALKEIADKPVQPTTLGLWTNGISDGKVFGQKTDSWCACNNRKILCTDRFMMVHKGLCASDDIILEESMLINKTAIPKYKERNLNFHEMKIELGDNFCLPQFTPIEHYYSRERHKLNLQEEKK